jgi:hypothetical protein
VRRAFAVVKFFAVEIEPAAIDTIDRAVARPTSPD